jgi:sialidase-1
MPSLLIAFVLMCVFSVSFSLPVDVFVAGDSASEGVLQWRIPSLVFTGNRTLLAFAEGRTDPQTDCGYKWIAVRRSTDGGATWSKDIPVGFVGGFGNKTWASGNPMAVFHAPSNKVVVVFGSKDLRERGGCSPGSGVFVVDDGGSDGLTWGEPRNISADLGGLTGPAGWGGVVPGPGAGAVLTRSHAGRIIMSGSLGAYGRDVVFYSDDVGLTWTPSTTPLENMDESGVAELNDGSIYITMRNAHRTTCDCQAYSVSTDGGVTFGPILYDANLPSPICQASAAARTDGVLYFSNPASKTERANTTVRRTSAPATGGSGGIQWAPRGVVVAPGLAWGGYSSLIAETVKRDKSGAAFGGILYERNSSATDVISFDTFNLDF